jgi:hypothetical protein
MANRAHGFNLTRPDAPMRACGYRRIAASLAKGGLRAAIEELARRAPVPVGPQWRRC